VAEEEIRARDRSKVLNEHLGGNKNDIETEHLLRKNCTTNQKLAISTTHEYGTSHPTALCNLQGFRNKLDGKFST
jgi:hypothetical protein